MSVKQNDDLPTCSAPRRSSSLGLSLNSTGRDRLLVGSDSGDAPQSARGRRPLSLLNSDNRATNFESRPTSFKTQNGRRYRVVQRDPGAVQSAKHSFKAVGQAHAARAHSSNRSIDIQTGVTLSEKLRQQEILIAKLKNEVSHGVFTHRMDSSDKCRLLA